MLSRATREAIEGADRVLVSPVSFFEISQKVRLGKWPDMVQAADRLAALLNDQGGQSIDIDVHIATGGQPRLGPPRPF